MSPDRSVSPPEVSTQVGSLPLRDPVHAAPDTTLQAAAALLRDEGISSLVVDTKPLSFLTERDLVAALADGRASTDPVATVATPSPVWLPPTVTLAHAAALMAALGVRHLLVRDVSGEVLGVLSIRDALGALVRTVEVDSWLSVFAAPYGAVG